MKTVLDNARFWAAGILVAAIGVAAARVIGPSLAGSVRVAVTVGGQLVALSGLFIICLGVRRRLKRAEES